MSRVEDEVCEADRQWFVDHPGATSYERDARSGEFSNEALMEFETSSVFGLRVRVTQVAEGVRSRFLYSVPVNPTHALLLQVTASLEVAEGELSAFVCLYLGCAFEQERDFDCEWSFTTPYRKDYTNNFQAAFIVLTPEFAAELEASHASFYADLKALKQGDPWPKVVVPSLGVMD